MSDPNQLKTVVPRRRIWTPWRVFFLALILVLVAGRFYEAGRVPVDDAFITFRFAKNLMDGHGLGFNVGERVEGYTSFGQLLLVAPAAAIGKIAVQLWAVLLGLLAWAGVAALVWRQVVRVRGAASSAYLEWLLVLYLALCTPGVMWSNSGMETALFALAWVAAWALHLREVEDDRWPWASGLTVFAAGLLHPEGVLIGLVLAVSWLAPFTKKRLARAVMFGAIAWGLFGLYWLWRWSYFGYFMPNTYYAKVGSGGALLHAGLTYLWLSSLSMLTPLVLLALLAWRGRTWRTWPRWLWVALGLIGILCAYVVQVGGDYFAFQRFLLPTIPFFAIAVWYFARDILTTRGKAPAKRPLLWASVTVFALVAWSNIMPPGHMLQHKLLQRVMKEYIAAGTVLGRTVPEGATIATIPIGAFGLYSEHRILDLVGLTDLHLAHLDVATGTRVVGHEKYDYGYVMERQPEIILQLPALFGFGEAGLRQWLQKTTLNTQQYTMYQYVELRENYRLCWHPVPKPRRMKGAAGQNPRVGVYAYVRNDLVGTQPYHMWRELPGPLAHFPFAEWKNFARQNQSYFGSRGLGMWRFSHVPLPPDDDQEPEQVWPPPAAEPTVETPPA